jgi:hypothetical protein
MPSSFLKRLFEEVAAGAIAVAAPAIIKAGQKHGPTVVKAVGKGAADGAKAVKNKIDNKKKKDGPKPE